MNIDELNRWAAEYVGEEADEIDASVASEFYTRSFGAASVILWKAMSEGKDITIVVGDKKLTVAAELPEQVIEAIKQLYDT